MTADSGPCWLHASCTLCFEVTLPAPMVLMLRPRSGPGQWVAREEYRLTPAVPVLEFTDGFGNLCQRLVAPPGDFRIDTAAEVMVTPEAPPEPDAPFVEIPALPDDVLVFLLPSRFCECDRFGEQAHAIVGDATPGRRQVTAITDWVRESVSYTPGSSPVPISAVEVNQRGEGVCRDLAHLAIALCRALCIPARLVVGYLHELEPMDIHAWFEAYVGGSWHTFDPSIPDDSAARIAIAHGRDASDVAIYNQYGPRLLPDEMQVSVAKLARSS